MGFLKLLYLLWYFDSKSFLGYQYLIKNKLLVSKRTLAQQNKGPIHLIAILYGLATRLMEKQTR